MEGSNPRRGSGVYYWRKPYFRTLKDVAAEAGAFPEWAEYAAFCTKYELGLRKQAFAALDRFVSVLERAPFAERRRFVSWLLPRADGREGQHMLISHPLHLRVVEPTLLGWTLVEPECSEPHRWLGGYEHLKRAIELEPADEIARRKLIVSILSRVGFSIHELPNGYLGKAREDLAALREAEALLEGLSSEEDRRELAVDIMEEKSLVEEYLRKK